MATLNVPVPHPTIAAAMAAANPGDTIALAAGYVSETATVSKDNLLFTGDASNTGIGLTLDGTISQLRIDSAFAPSVTGSAVGDLLVDHLGTANLRSAACPSPAPMRTPRPSPYARVQASP